MSDVSRHTFHGQKGEDRYVYETVFQHGPLDTNPSRQGLFLELGAMDGKTFSNTKFFEDELGWTGILIEPHPRMFERLQRYRPQCKLYNTVVSCETMPIAFQVNERHPGVSGVSDSFPDHFSEVYYADPQKSRSEHILPRALSDILMESGFSFIDFFSLDVEGHELSVLKSMDFQRFPVRALLVEALRTTPKKNAEVRSFLEGQGFDFHSTFEHNELFLDPAFSA